MVQVISLIYHIVIKNKIFLISSNESDLYIQKIKDSKKSFQGVSFRFYAGDPDAPSHKYRSVDCKSV